MRRNTPRRTRIRRALREKVERIFESRVLTIIMIILNVAAISSMISGLIWHGLGFAAAGGLVFLEIQRHFWEYALWRAIRPEKKTA